MDGIPDDIVLAPQPIDGATPAGIVGSLEEHRPDESMRKVGHWFYNDTMRPPPEVENTMYHRISEVTAIFSSEAERQNGLIARLGFVADGMYRFENVHLWDRKDHLELGLPSASRDRDEARVRVVHDSLLRPLLNVILDALGQRLAAAGDSESAVDLSRPF